MATPPVAQTNAHSAPNMSYNIHNHNHNPMSPAQSPTAPKSVAFELMVQNIPQFKARLPMRVQIFPHDTTESIISTVKNFYGLYGSAYGISFEDDRGNTLIARYENLHDKMNVNVRVTENALSPAASQFGAVSYQSGTAPEQSNYWNVEHQMLPPQPATTRPNSRASNGRSISPSRGRRSGSASTSQRNKKPRSGGQSRGSSTHGSFADIYSDGANGYSSGDGAPGSVSSRSRGDVGQSDISVANIVEGGRRKRAKFESSVSIYPPGVQTAIQCSTTARWQHCFSQWHTMLTLLLTGASTLCTSTDASCNLQFVCLSRPTHGAAESSNAISTSRTARLCASPCSAVSTKLW